MEGVEWKGPTGWSFGLERALVSEHGEDAAGNMPDSVEVVVLDFPVKNATICHG